MEIEATVVYTNIYDAVCGQMKMLSDITNTMGNSISFTTEVWSDTSAQGISLPQLVFLFLSLTAHAINRDLEKVKFVV